MYKIIEDTKIVDWRLPHYSSCNLLAGWPKHAIFISVQYDNISKQHDFIMINAGIGSEIQGIYGDLCNGIIIIKNVSLEKIQNFLKFYYDFYNNSYSDKEFEQEKRYYSFYFLMIDKLLGIQNEVNFNELIKNGKIINLKINSQILGTCGFTNHIAYICYLLYKKDPKIDYNLCFNTWYKKAKTIMKKKIYDEIISYKDIEKVNKNFNIYKYIIETENLLKNNDYETVLYDFMEIKNIEFIKVKYPNNSINISRNDIFKYNDKLSKCNYYDIFWELYNFNNIKFYELIKCNLNDHSKLLYILEMLNLFNKECNCCDNNISSIVPLFELYKLKKYYSIQIDDDILYKFTKIIFNNSYESYHKFIYICIIMLLIKDLGNPYYSNIDISNENKKIYNFLLSKIPLVNGHYFELIKTIINDIKDNINYFPNFEIIKENEKKDVNKDVNKFAYFINDLIELYKLEENFFLNFKYENILDNKFGKIFFEANNSQKNVIYLITKENKKINNFLISSIYMNNNDLFIDYNIYDIYEQIGYVNLDIPDKNNLLNNYIYSSSSYYFISENITRQVSYKDGIIDLPGAYYPHLHKIKLFKENIKQKLIEGSDNPNLFNYIIYFYLCEIEGKKIDAHIFNIYDQFIENYFITLALQKPYKPLIYTYLLRYCKKSSYETYLIEINNNTLIPENEKKYFHNNKYYY